MKSNSSKNEPIAIIGMGCRFPGANNPDEFWQLLREGRDAITEIPSDRFDIESYYCSEPATPGKMSTRWGGFIRDLDQFDPYFFGMSPREAERLDPQQRLLLEVTWEAIEDAGQDPKSLAGSSAGVFVGIWINDYEQRLFQDSGQIDFYMTTGSGRYTASGRVSHFLGLQGPSLTLDTACSSSLVAVHQACRSLWNGECDLALAGGSNTILSPNISIAYSQSRMLSPDGRCKFGDARANGYVRSDGAGVIALKPLSRALSDKNPIYALIRGGAVNNDGHTSGSLGTPGVAGQEDLLRKAYANAAVHPNEVHYVEAHGTGTSVGDPVEIEALGNVIGSGRAKDHPCIVGSVKTNIGHTEGAAGVAGVIKVALAMKHRELPPTLHFNKPNPRISWEKLPLSIEPKLRSWPCNSEPALAGVSSFGISGTNAHLVLQELSDMERWPDGVKESTTRSNLKKNANSTRSTSYFLQISGHVPEALQENVRRYKLFLENDPKAENGLSDVCYAASRRSSHDHRLAVAANDKNELIDRLDAYLTHEHRPGLSSGQKRFERKPKLVFVFPGQGSQWFGMARQLLACEPVFLESMKHCEQALREFVRWSLLEQLALDESDSKLNEIGVIQPTLFSIQVSLAALWRSWDVEPDAVIGQSMGEVAAAHVAGALTLEDAARIICRRSRLLKRASGKGAMAVVELSMIDAEKALNGFQEQLSIAVSSSSRSTVLSGDPKALDTLIEELERQDVFCRKINVDVASHSPQMDGLKSDLLKAISGLQPRSASIPIYSTVRGQKISGDTLDENYWVDNLRQPVLFASTLRKLQEDAHEIYIEISPHPVLLPAIEQELGSSERGVLVLPSVRRDEDEQIAMLESLGTLYCVGYPANWQRLYPDRCACVSLPTYAWQRERFWYADRLTSNPTTAFQNNNVGHPLLGHHIGSSVHTETHFWQADLSTVLLPYLADHVVQGATVLPAAAYIEMILAGALETFGSRASVIETLEIDKALLIPAQESQTIQLVFAQDMPDVFSFKLLSSQVARSNESASWTLNAKGAIRLNRPQPEPVVVENTAPAKMQEKCGKAQSASEHYQTMFLRGLQYGPNFQTIEKLWCGKDEVLAQIRLPESAKSGSNIYRIHPAILDAGFQALIAVLSAKEGITDTDTYLPVSAEQIRLLSTPDYNATLWAHAKIKEGTTDNNDFVGGEVSIIDDLGTVLLKVPLCQLKRVQRDPGKQMREWFYRIDWQKNRLDKASKQGPQSSTESGQWLIFADRQGVADRLAQELQKCNDKCVLVYRGEALTRKEDDTYEISPINPADYVQLLSEVFHKDAKGCKGVIHTWSLDSRPDSKTTTADLNDAQDWGCGSVLHLTKELIAAERPESPRLWLVTSQTQAVADSDRTIHVTHSPLWGLGRVIANEHPEFNCTSVDLSSELSDEEINALFEEVSLNGDDNQIALRGAARYTAYLIATPEASVETLKHTRSEKKVQIPAEKGYRLGMTTPGILDQLTLFPDTRTNPGSGEIEIQVWAAGLNFLDVMKAMRVYPGLNYDDPISLGGECAGTVVAVGDGVSDFKVGDEVVAITPSFNSRTMISGFVTVPVSSAILKPKHLTSEEAATFPVAFLTAYYGLHCLASMSKGERVLIHSATGGVGLAAIQLAQKSGAEIFATAGSPEKREFLKSLGVKHVMDSRSLTFANEIMERTDGEGVDIILSSLNGEAIIKNLEVLRPYGRFVEIGKRDIYDNSRIGLEPFKKNLSFFAVDLAHMVEARPEFIATLFEKIAESFKARSFEPLCYKTFPVSEAATAFREMAQAKHVGKIVLSLNDEEVWVAPTRDTIQTQATYVITGGSGALGLQVAKWLISKGAQHLVLVGRSTPSAEVRARLAELRAGGAEIVVGMVDVSKECQVADMLATIRRTMPPLKGVIHAAGLLADSTLLKMDREQFDLATAAKVYGAWNLHKHTLNDSLDFFVMFSSVASVLGLTGQSNYAAGNAFMDALAHYRAKLSLPATSINWAPWSQVGLAAAESNRGKRLASQGLGSIAPEQGCTALEVLLSESPVQVLLMPFDLSRWQKHNPVASKGSLFSKLDHQRTEQSQVVEETTANSDFREQLQATEPGRKRSELMENYLRNQVAQVLKLQVSRIGLKQPLRTLGLDSLMALELRNRLERGLGLILPATAFFNYPTIAVLTPSLASKMGLSLEAASPATDTDGVSRETASDNQMDHADQGIEAVLGEIENISDDDARQILNE